MEMINTFLQKNAPILKGKEKVDFDFLFSLMKPELLSYKSYYEVFLYNL